MSNNWIAMFSHTGSEIASISKKLGKWPDKIITNKEPGDKSISKALGKELMFCSKKPSVSDYRRLFARGDFITMHGWMQILPSKICSDYDIYNLHPGLITKYPELKGKDPQKRVFGSKVSYDHVGCILHKATGVLDSGPVIMERSTSNSFTGPNHLSEYLHEMSTEMWTEYISFKLHGEAGLAFRS